MSIIKLMLVAQANGGVSEYLKSFVKYINKDEYDVTLVLSNQYKIEKDNLLKLGCNIYFIDMVREINFKKDILSICNFKKIVKEVKPDLIYAHSSKAGVIVRLTVSHKKVPIIYNAHGWSFNMQSSKRKRKLYANIEKICAYNTSKIVCISDYEKKSALNLNICNGKKITTIYNGIDLKKIKKVNRNKILQKIGFPQNALVIGQVGRLDEQKNPLMFVDIAKNIIETNNNAYFILVGDGNLKKQVQNRIEEYKLEERFHITGWISNVSDYISCFDIGMLTSKWEGFGLVLVEYMSLGVPVIASNVDGIPDVVVNEFNGILCNYEKKDEFVNSVNRVIVNKKLASELSTNGQISAAINFSIERVVNEHSEVFKKLINN